MNIAFPYQVDSRGRTAAANDEDHIRDLIEQVLFTSPGERVNRPDFGCGLMQLVFAPASNGLAAAAQLTVQGALQLWLGDLIAIESVEVSSTDSTLNVVINYVIRRSQTQRTAHFERGF